MTPKQIHRIKEAQRDADRPLYFEFDGTKYELHLVTVIHENGGHRSRKLLTIWGNHKTSGREKADAVHEELRGLDLPVGISPGDAYCKYIMRKP